jgi:hypothetical protein
MSDIVDMENLLPQQLIKALVNSGYEPRHRIIEARFARHESPSESGAYGGIYVYDILWDNVEDYTDLLLSCETLYITEHNDILYADI